MDNFICIILSNYHSQYVRRISLVVLLMLHTKKIKLRNTSNLPRITEIHRNQGIAISDTQIGLFSLLSPS